MKLNRKKKGYIATVALLGTLGAASIMPVAAHAETELQALKRAVVEQDRKMAEQSRQIAEQRALIDKLLSAQTSQKETIDKIVTRATQEPPAGLTPQQALDQQIKKGVVPKDSISGLLPRGFFIYGKLDANVASRDSGYGRKLYAGTNGMTGSSVALKLDRELAPGWHMLANLDVGIDAAMGIGGNGASSGTSGANLTGPGGGINANGDGIQLFSREAYIGMGSDAYGQVKLGRQYSGSFIVTFYEGNAFGLGMYGATTSFLTYMGMPSRVNNSITYRTPIFDGFLKGFSLYALYSTGNQHNVDGRAPTTSGGTTYLEDTSGSGVDVSLSYRHAGWGWGWDGERKPTSGLTAVLSGWNIENGTYYTVNPPRPGFSTGTPQPETGMATKRGIQLAANYDFGVAKLFATYIRSGYGGGNYANGYAYLSDAEGWTFSGRVPFGRHAFIASYAQINDKSFVQADATLLGVGYTYQVFESTLLYANWGKLFNTGKYNYGLKSSADMVATPIAGVRGVDPDAVMVGVNYTF